uniref:Phosphoinositide phospholipase C n=1 Tax=Timema bartmani TaxID=61472 RepID=A0A7R9EWX3_9NEOP|nr:unnamed protein product [Timema bartmani]
MYLTVRRCLRYLIARDLKEDVDGSVYGTPGYMDPSSFTSKRDSNQPTTTSEKHVCILVILSLIVVESETQTNQQPPLRNMFGSQLYEGSPEYGGVYITGKVGVKERWRVIIKTDGSTISAMTTLSQYLYLSLSQVTVKAVYDYQAQRDDELSFCKHAIITNVNKQDDSGWWRGDYGGKKQHFFPSNYVQEMEPQENRDTDNSDSMLLGNLQKGTLDVMGAVVELSVGGRPGLEWILRIQNPNMCTAFEVAVPQREQALEWMASIKETAQNATVRENQHKEMERAWRIAKEMSNLIIYCRSVAFNADKIRQQGYIFYEMSSFPETKAEKLICQQENKFFLKYHQVGQRIDSSNYNPVPMWNSGSQMVALNYQTPGQLYPLPGHHVSYTHSGATSTWTPDKAMQLNQGKFRENGNCGYLLRPEFMFRDEFDPYDKNTLVGVDPLTISIRVIGARHLSKTGRGTASPFVEIEVVGADFDSGVKLTTKTVTDNGFNPVWNEICEFDIANPPYALLRFVVQDEDMFGDSNFIGQATYPLMPWPVTLSVSNFTHNPCHVPNASTLNPNLDQDLNF